MLPYPSSPFSYFCSLSWVLWRSADVLHIYFLLIYSLTHHSLVAALTSEMSLIKIPEELLAIISRDSLQSLCYSVLHVVDFALFIFQENLSCFDCRDNPHSWFSLYLSELSQVFFSSMACFIYGCFPGLFSGLFFFFLIVHTSVGQFGQESRKG